MKRWLARGERRNFLKWMVRLTGTATAVCLIVWLGYPLLDKVLTPTYELTLVNGGQLRIVGGALEGDARVRPVGEVAPGQVRAFVFRNTGAVGADYWLRLVREDSTRVECRIGVLPPTWDIDVGSHDRLVIPDDTCRVVRTDDQLNGGQRTERGTRPWPPP